MNRLFNMNRLFVIFLGVMLSYSIVLSVIGGLPGLAHVPDQPSPGLVDYTPEQLAGREIYKQNGCFYCHSQQVRAVEMDTVYLHGTRPSVPSDYVYDRPHFMGTMRTGEDFANIGRKYMGEDGRKRLTEILNNPRTAVPETFMPSFHHLGESEIASLVVYLQSLGTWKEAYSGEPEALRPDYWNEIPDRAEAAIETVTEHPTYIYPIFIVSGLAMVFVFAGIGWAWQRSHFKDAEEPAIRMIHEQE